MNALPFFAIGLPGSAPAAPAGVPWPAAGQANLFAELLQASLAKSPSLADPWPVPEDADTWSPPKPTDADPAFLPDTNVPAPASFVLSSEAGPAIASLEAATLEAWLADQGADVPQRQMSEEITPAPDRFAVQTGDAIELKSGEIIRRIAVRIDANAATLLRQGKAPVDLEFDMTLPRPLPFAIPAELDIPNRPLPVPESIPVAEPGRVPDPVALPVARKMEKHPTLRESSADVARWRAPVLESHAGMPRRLSQEVIADLAHRTAQPAIQRTPEVAVFASQQGDQEIHLVREYERGRVRPLQITPIRCQTLRPIAAAGVEAPERAVPEPNEPAVLAARYQDHKAQSIPDFAPNPQSHPGLAASLNPDSGPASLLESLADGRMQNREAEAPVPVRFVLEEWAAGQPVKSVRMLLEPKELGGLRVFLRHNHQGIHARIVADRAEALPQVEAGMSALRGMLHARGIQFSSYSLTALTAAGAAGLRPNGMPNGESAGDRQSTRLQGKGKRTGRTTRS